MTMQAIIVFDEEGDVQEVLVVASDEKQAAIVEGALARLTRPESWAWLKRFFKR